MSQAAALLVLRAHTGIHAGVGQEVGTVDLPIQRERVTNFPVVRGPSLKGALRQAAQEKGIDKKTSLLWLFGPETQDADKYGGALSVADARLLLFPMRSLVGTFAWLTCPFALKRLKRDLEDSGLKQKIALPDPPGISAQATVAIGSKAKNFHESRQGQPVRISKHVVVEDYGLEANDALTAGMDSLHAQMKSLGLPEEELRARNALVTDDVFQSFVTFATEVVTRVHLDDETKTVKRGQLWTEELLPAESVLTALVICGDQREKSASKKTGPELLKELCDKVKGRFQIGGNETVGYGICHAQWIGPITMS